MTQDLGAWDNPSKSTIEDGPIPPHQLIEQLRQIGFPALLLAPMGPKAEDSIFGHFIGRNLATGLILNVTDLKLSQGLILELHPKTGVSFSIHIHGHQTVRYEGNTFRIDAENGPLAIMLAHAQEDSMQRHGQAGDHLRAVTVTLTDQWISKYLPASHPLRSGEFKAGSRDVKLASARQIEWAEALLDTGTDGLRGLRQEGLAAMLTADLLDSFFKTA